jgi:uncharacterized protein (TIGR02996 family)
MRDEEPFLKAILAEPDDDTLRLVFADWLEEHGQPERAEFIRVQCALAAAPSSDPRREDLAAREKALLCRHYQEWAQPLHAVTPTCHVLSFARGFPATLAMRLDDFLEHAPQLFASAPLQGLRLQVERIDADRRHEQVRRLASCPYLRRLIQLDLSGNVVTSIDAEILASSPNLHRLRHLDLTRTALRNEGALALSNSPHLQNAKLLLAGNAISYRVLDQIERASHQRRERWPESSPACPRLRGS